MLSDAWSFGIGPEFDLASPSVIAITDLSLRLGRVKRLTHDAEGDRESVTTHSFMLALLCVELAPSTLNREALLLRALCHDLPEALVGDTPTLIPLTREQEAKKAVREEAAEKAIMAADVSAINLHLRFSPKSLEHRFVHLIDKIAPRLTGVRTGLSSVQENCTRQQLKSILEMQDAALATEHPEEVFQDALLLGRRLSEQMLEMWAPPAPPLRKDLL